MSRKVFANRAQAFFIADIFIDIVGAILLNASSVVQAELLAVYSVSSTVTVTLSYLLPKILSLVM